MKKDSIKRKILVSALTASVLAFGAATSAQANLWMAYSGTDGTNSFAGACQDGAACDTNILTGTIALNPLTLINPLPGLIITNLGTTSTISPGPGGVNTLLGGSLIATYGALTNVVAPVAGFVTIHTAFGDVNYVGPSTSWTTTGSGTWGTVGGVGSSTTGSSSLMTFYNDPENNQGAEDALDRPGNLVNSVNSIATGNILDSFAFTNNGLLTFPDGAQYSMTLGTDFVLVAGASLASQGQGIAKSTTTIPEPGSMLLLGAALAGMGFTRRYKAK